MKPDTYNYFFPFAAIGYFPFHDMQKTSEIKLIVYLNKLNSIHNFYT